MPAPDSQILTKKDVVLVTALYLFSENGYKEVTVRQIAKAVGINVSSLYNHFASKEEILAALYDMYTDHLQKVEPDLEELLRLAETEPPHEVLMRLDYHVDPSVQDIMYRILGIATREFRIDSRSEQFMREHVLEKPTKSITLLLNRMMELGRIEPIDVDAIASLLATYSIGAVLLNNTALEIGLDAWRRGLQISFSFIKPTVK